MIILQGGKEKERKNSETINIFEYANKLPCNKFIFIFLSYSLWLICVSLQLTRSLKFLRDFYKQ